jgi:hypothetical protein
LTLHYAIEYYIYIRCHIEADISDTRLSLPEAAISLKFYFRVFFLPTFSPFEFHSLSAALPFGFFSYFFRHFQRHFTPSPFH